MTWFINLVRVLQYLPAFIAAVVAVVKQLVNFWRWAMALVKTEQTDQKPVLPAAPSIQFKDEKAVVVTVVKPEKPRPKAEQETTSLIDGKVYSREETYDLDDLFRKGQQ